MGGKSRGRAPTGGHALTRLHEAMQHWEYLTFDLVKRKTEVEQLNRLGQEGWEAVAMVSSWGVGWRFVHPIVLLKRPRTDAADPSRR